MLDKRIVKAILKFIGITDPDPTLINVFNQKFGIYKMKVSVKMALAILIPAILNYVEMRVHGIHPDDQLKDNQ